MDLMLLRLLRLSAGCVLLRAAWAHFFWEVPYQAVIEAHPELSHQLGIHPEAGGRIAFGFGICLFLGGVFAALWRPAWLGRALVVAGLLPLLAANASVTSLPALPSVLASGLWAVCAVLALGLFHQERLGPVRLILRIGITTLFGVWSVLALGGAGEVPASWLHIVRIVWPGGGELEHLRVFGALTAVGCVALWIRPLVPVGAVLLASSGLGAMVAPVAMNLDAGAMVTLQQHLPEAVGRAGLVLLPAVIALSGGPMSFKTAPRKLKRVDLPVEPEGAL
jgi:hypothetical protein